MDLPRPAQTPLTRSLPSMSPAWADVGERASFVSLSVSRHVLLGLVGLLDRSGRDSPTISLGGNGRDQALVHLLHDLAHGPA